MLDNVDSYEGSGNTGEEAREVVGDADSLFTKLKRWIKTDYNSKGQVKWRKEAREDFDFEAEDYGDTQLACDAREGRDALIECTSP
jgi:hypothetical protein